jgi:hypothetical protein
MVKFSHPGQSNLEGVTRLLLENLVLFFFSFLTGLSLHEVNRQKERKRQRLTFPFPFPLACQLLTAPKEQRKK